MSNTLFSQNEIKYLKSQRLARIGTAAISNEGYCVNVDNKTISEFLSLNNSTTAFRPTDAVFSQNGTSLYEIKHSCF